MSTLLIVLIFVCFGAPWTWLLLRHSTDRTLEGAIDRVCLGYACSFFLLFVSAQLRLWLFAPIWVAGVLACLVLAFRRKQPAPPPLVFGREGWVLAITSALYLGLRSLPFTQRRLPLGWDAYFHMTISESIVARGQAVHDWLPYEDIPLNYPIGSHLLLAFTQWLTAVRPHQFFEFLVVLFTWLSGIQLFSLGSRATNDRQIGCYAALAYLFLGNYGSLHYAIWSGLPNLIGMYLFLGLLSSLATPATSLRRASAVFVICLLAACFVHHHVMVTAGACLVWLAAYSFVRGDRALARRVLVGLVTAGLVGSPYFLMYLFRSAGLGNTGIQAYMENRADAVNIAQDVGIGLAFASAAGIYLYFKDRVPVAPVVHQPLTALLALFVAIEFVFRTLSQTLLGHEMSPFTPSRFLTDAVTLLAIFAAIFFRSMQGAHAAIRLPIVALIVGGFFWFNRAVYRDTFNHEISRERRATYEWIRKHAAPDAVVLDNDLHATYMTRRMSNVFPLPTSEYSARAFRSQQLEAIAAGREPPERAGRPVLAIVEPGARAPQGVVVWQHPSGFRVVERVGPALGTR